MQAILTAIWQVIQSALSMFNVGGNIDLSNVQSWLAKIVNVPVWVLFGSVLFVANVRGFWPTLVILVVLVAYTNRAVNEASNETSNN